MKQRPVIVGAVLYEPKVSIIWSMSGSGAEVDPIAAQGPFLARTTRSGLVACFLLCLLAFWRLGGSVGCRTAAQ